MTASTRRTPRPALLAAAAGLCLIPPAAHAQTSWAAPVSGSWFDPTRWTAGVPSTNAATIGLTGAYTVTLQNASGSAGSLTISNPAAVLSIFDNTQLTVSGNISNAGLIQISGPGAPGNLTRLAVNAPNVLHSGGGTIRLAALGNGDNDTAYITNFPATGLTNAAGSFVAGAGRIYAPFNNSGTVNADQNGKGLFLQQFGKTNDGLITATNGGFLQLRTSMTQGPTGLMQSTNNSPIQINNSNATVAGGTLDGAGTNAGIQYFGVATIDGVTLENANMVMDGCQVNLGPAGVVNNGTWTVSAPTAPGNLTRIATGASPATISGTGTIRLQGVASGNGDNDTAYLTYAVISATLTNASTHSILGYGRIYTPLVNDGLVNADVAGKGIFMIDRPKFNSGTMTASSGGLLQFRTPVTQTSSGIIISSDNSPVQFNNAVGLTSGGTLNGAGANSGIQYFGSNQLESVTLLNNHMVMDGAIVNIRDAGVVNNGLWTVSSPTAPGNFTRIATGGTGNPTSATISGTGTIRLQGVQSGNGDNDTAYLTYGTVNDVLTNAAGHSIRGYGRIYANLVNNGTIVADNTPNASGPASKGLFFIDRPKINNGTITATNGGFVQFRGITVTGNPSAQIISTDAASPVQMVNATMTGGGFTTSGTGVFQYFGSNTLSNLTVNGTHQITDAALVNLATDFTNNGNWLISQPTAPGNFTRMQAAAPSVTINGTGTIRLQGVQSGNGDNDTAYLQYTAAANVLTLGAGQQLLGYGRVYTELVNNGTIHADNIPNASGPTSKGIILIDRPKTNNSTITSSSGGFWYVRGITLTNNGTLSSSNTTTPGGGFENCTVVGGTITNIANQFFGTAGTANLNGVTITPGSGIQVNDASNLQTNGLTNNGTILVQSIGAPGNLTRITAANNANATINGTGTIRLQATAFNSSTSYLQGPTATGQNLTLDAGQTLTGTGRLFSNIIINGTVSPDKPFGTPDAWGSIQPRDGSLTLGTTSAFNAQIRSATIFDSMQGNSAITITGGTLNVSFDPAYVPSSTHRFDLIQGSTVTGQFATANLTQPPAYTGRRERQARRPRGQPDEVEAAHQLPLDRQGRRHPADPAARDDAGTGHRLHRRRRDGRGHPGEHPPAQGDPVPARTQEGQAQARNGIESGTPGHGWRQAIDRCLSSCYRNRGVTPAALSARNRPRINHWWGTGAGAKVSSPGGMKHERRGSSDHRLRLDRNGQIASGGVLPAGGRSPGRPAVDR
ncbi:hypothetical protein J4558_06570 [Leptolyngbya sp. 15MV]|nr:hypothetical protein J4558_06570 [Leptolyngbya sp. 15MV]